MRDFQKTVHEFARRHGCVAQPLDDAGAFNWSGPIAKPTLGELAVFESTVLDEETRILALQQLAQNAKNASLGKTPEQIAETLKIQVNLGIGGLLTMIQRDRAVVSRILLEKSVCTQGELDAAFAHPSLDALNEVITARLTYWQWISAVDAEVLACIADPNRTPTFPAPPQL